MEITGVGFSRHVFADTKSTVSVQWQSYHKILFQSVAYHPCVSVYLCLCDLDFDLMTLTLDLDIDVMKIYLLTKNTVGQGIQKL